MDVRKKSEPSRWELLWIQPAHAVTVYLLMLVMVVAIILGAIEVAILYSRTSAVCEPLRSGQDLGKQAATDIGRQFAETFGHSADKLGCHK